MSKTIFQINLRRVKDNLNYLKKLSNNEIIPVLKANAYGLGACTIAKMLCEEKYRKIFCSSIEEAKEIMEKTFIKTRPT